jgi:choice-of-anchor A domain-containing protein
MRSPIPPTGVAATVFAVLSPLLGLLTPLASAQNLQALKDYSVITSGDFSTTSDVEGRTMVGGNLTGSNSANFGIKLQNEVPSSDLTLRVAGNIGSGNSLNVNAGSIELGGTSSRSVNYNGGGHLVLNPGVSYADTFAALNDASHLLSGATANSTAGIPSGQPGPLNFNATPNSAGLAIFNVAGALVFNNSSVQQLQINASTATDIVINVSGTVINWTSGNLVGLFTQNYWRSNIIWNFYQATTINFGSYNMMGQVLAPNADVTTNGNIDGSIYAKSLTTGSEVHLPGYAGNVTVPEPTAPVMIGLLGGLLVLRRRRC